MNGELPSGRRGEEEVPEVVRWFSEIFYSNIIAKKS